VISWKRYITSQNNIKKRLREMLKATVEVESTVGVGTKVLVKIPKNEETRLEEC
jgi:signal transduction histidine kinase